MAVIGLGYVGLPLAVEFARKYPVVGFDKTEIIERAREIGTFETSILPYEDCCTVFLPKHPVIRPSLKEVEQQEGRLDVEALVEEALASLETLHIG